VRRHNQRTPIRFLFVKQARMTAVTSNDAMYGGMLMLMLMLITLKDE
jgi:hypothetical protein